MKQILLGVAILGSAVRVLAAPELSAETSKPHSSCFVRNDVASMTVHARGFEPDSDFPLKVEIADYKGDAVDSFEARFQTDSEGSWDGSFSLPTERFGCFRVGVSSGDCALKKRGSCPAGLLTYAVLRDPMSRPQITWKDSFFGSYGVSHWMGLRIELNGQATKANAEEGRRFVEEWSTNECFKAWPVRYWHDVLFRPDARTYNNGFWSDEARAWILDHVKKGDFSRKLMFHDPQGFTYLREVLPRMVRASREQALPGEEKRLYEMMWEPDLGLDVPTVVKVAAALKEAIDREDPDGGVTCFPSVSNIRYMTYHRQLIEAGLLEYLNAYSIHPYVSYPPEPNGLVSHIRELKRMIRDRIGHDLPLYGTEQGFAEPGTIKGEQRQMNGILRSNFILLGEGFEKNLIFYGVDFGNDNGRDQNGDYGLFFNLELDRVRHGSRYRSPRASAAAVAAATWIVDGKRPTACLEGTWGPSSLGYCYADADDKCVIVLWDYGAGSKAEIPVGKDAIVVADVMGNEREVACPEGMLELTLTETPVYVIGPDSKMWGHRGTMAATLAEEAARKAAEREASVKIRIHSVEPAFIGKIPAVRADVENRTDNAVEIVVEANVFAKPAEGGHFVPLFGEVRLPDTPAAAHGEASIRFSPGERKSVVVALDGFAPSPFSEFSLETTAKFSDGYVAKQHAAANFWKAERIEGDPNEWHPRRHDDIGRSMWDEERMEEPSPEDFSAKVAFGWNDSWLVGDIIVTDDTHVGGPAGFMSWNGDSVQLGIAKCALEQLSGNNLLDMDMQAPSEVTLALGAIGTEAYRTISFDPNRFPAGHDGAGAIPPESLPLKVTREGTTTHYRFMVPWDFFNIAKPEPGKTVRIAALFNDRDISGEPLPQVRLFELKKEVPRRFGFIVLEK